MVMGGQARTLLKQIQNQNLFLVLQKKHLSQPLLDALRQSCEFHLYHRNRPIQSGRRNRCLFGHYRRLLLHQRAICLLLEWIKLLIMQCLKLSMSIIMRLHRDHPQMVQLGLQTERPQWIRDQICLLRMIHLRWRNKVSYINSSAPFWGRRPFLVSTWIVVCLSLVTYFPRLSYAEISWVKYYRTKGAEFFYNPASLRKSTDLREANVFVLSNYLFQTNSGEKSVLVRQRLDCKRGRYKILAFKSFSKRNAKGKMIISNGVSKGWLYIVPRTPDSILQKIVCSG